LTKLKFKKNRASLHSSKDANAHDRKLREGSSNGKLPDYDAGVLRRVAITGVFCSAKADAPDRKTREGRCDGGVGKKEIAVIIVL
jgi:hypothetical protein